jgi:hypothetical protein
MAINDIKADVTPVNTKRPAAKPIVSALRTALNTYNATSYSTTRLNAMTKLDMLNAARIHGLTVDGV